MFKKGDSFENVSHQNLLETGRYDGADRKIICFLGCSLDIFLKVRAMMFLYRLDRSKEPAYLCDLLQRGPSVRSKQFIIQRSDLQIGKKTLFVKGLVEWNVVPLRIKNGSSVNVFRSQCTEFFNRRSKLCAGCCIRETLHK